MLRNKGGFILIAVQIAVTMAIMVNAVAIIQQRSGDMARPSGLDETNTFTLASVSFIDGIDQKRLIDEDLERIRNLPGVVAATSSNSFPLRRGGSSNGVSTEPGKDVSDSIAALYLADEHTLDAFALTLVDGNNFAPNQVSWSDPEKQDWPPVAIVTEALARELFPDAAGSYVGKTFYAGNDDPVNIIGVVERLQAPWPGWAGVERSILVPRRSDDDLVRYIIRTEAGYRDELMPQVEEMLATASRERIIESVQTMEDVRKMAYLGEAGMIKMLSFVVALLTVITGLGIVGLASFNVSRRTRQIGIRRALGATRPSIVRHFMVENFLVSTVGIAAGGVLAVALNMLLVETFSLEPMAWYVIPAAMIVLWLVGQVAVAGPARRASNVTPAIATRSI
jgi:putative ABC transport system permease protein